MNNKQDDGWIEAGSMNEQTWTPEKEGDSITGVYVSLKTEVGMNKSNVYALQEEGKEGPTNVWGSTVLDARLAEVPETSLVYIEYLGTVKGKGPKPYKNYKVLYKPAEEMPEDFLKS